MIDGLRGAPNWRLGGWQGYQGVDFVAVVDLGSSKPIQKLAAGFVQDIRSWIWMPTEVRFYLSDDGNNFTLIAKKSNPIADNDYEIQTIDLESKVNTRGRFVKVEASNYGTIPYWHLGAGGNAYIFIDEIVIE